MSYYLMHRKWMDSDVFKNEPHTEREAWCWLIEKAIFSDEYTIKIKESPAKLKRGQLSYSIRYLAKAWGWKPNRVLTFLKKLKKWNMIQTVNQTGQTVITISNYKKYQTVDKKTKQQANSKSNRGQTEPQTNIKEVLKEGIKEGLEKPDSVSEGTWKDFIAHRKAKKAPLTETALNGIIREADKAGWGLEEALIETCTRGWQSFKAEWVDTKTKHVDVGRLNEEAMNA